jgi:hypothetical protein
MTHGGARRSGVRFLHNHNQYSPDDPEEIPATPALSPERQKIQQSWRSGGVFRGMLIF